MNSALEKFNNLVALRYQIYNSIFLTLNLDGVHQTGILLPLLSEICEDGLADERSPEAIIRYFFEEHTEYRTEEERVDQLFRFVQYIERQIVLVDALEDAAFSGINDLRGAGSYTALFQRSSNGNRMDKLREALENFRVRIVLTAHPTQFYPGPVLGIISDLDQAIAQNNLKDIKRFLEQLGKTPFFKKEKPTPYDEAISLIWYLENIFYHSIPALYEDVFQSLGDNAHEVIGDNPLLQLGFWPGGDRDGNPFVNTEITLKVAERLRLTLFRCYYRDVRQLKRRITFRGTEAIMDELQSRLYEATFTNPENAELTLDWFKNKLLELEGVLENEHNGLFADEVRTVLHKVKIFGFHFSTLDIRQDSRIISGAEEAVLDRHPEFFPKNFRELSIADKVNALFKVKGKVKPSEFDDPIVRDTLESFPTMREIKRKNGSSGAYRYIISNCRGALDVAHVFALARLSGWEGEMDFDIIPLFETVDDLRNAGDVMEELYNHPVYKSHLQKRWSRQVVMLGFSDGTKDGGYLTANWGIYKAKENITSVSRTNDFSVVFFDGRGGPPARGGGNTHKFYASLGNNIQSDQIQLTIQGETISSNFGTFDSSRYNLEQLFSAGLENKVLDDPDKNLDDRERKLLEELSEISYATYQAFKAHPCFVPYLERMSTLKYYGQTNIGSRPSKRGKSDELKFEDLRAIPFVGAWSQLKQNVPGFFGLGTTLQKMADDDRLNEVKELYHNSLFFRTLIENSMQSLSKTYFPLTRYMRKDEEFGDFWQWIYEESERARRYLLEVSGQKNLLETSPNIRESIKLREQIVLPLLVIQQNALIRIKQLEKEGKGKSLLAESYRKLVVRSLYGNINASRNSA
ncbi:MAG TPA: phosphoenolpyruvate carboxylase [Cryomorphaceae bacterium]|nr:phosphoenolpyruvate carboxylase [Cryomorphaceae bacterium]